MNKDKHCAHALTLSGGARHTYQIEHGLTPQEVWTWNRDHKDAPQTRSVKKKIRARVLASQGGCCALCGKSGAGRWYTDKSGKVVCCRCNQFLSTGRRLRAEGVTQEDVEAFVSETE